MVRAVVPNQVTDPFGCLGSDEQAQLWREREREVWALVVVPWVLVQKKPQEWRWLAVKQSAPSTHADRSPHVPVINS